jgi:hypothetical protein
MPVSAGRLLQHSVPLWFAGSRCSMLQRAVAQHANDSCHPKQHWQQSKVNCCLCASGCSGRSAGGQAGGQCCGSVRHRWCDRSSAGAATEARARGAAAAEAHPAFSACECPPVPQQRAIDMDWRYLHRRWECHHSQRASAPCWSLQIGPFIILQQLQPMLAATEAARASGVPPQRLPVTDPSQGMTAVEAARAAANLPKPPPPPQKPKRSPVDPVSRGPSGHHMEMLGCPVTCVDQTDTPICRQEREAFTGLTGRGRWFIAAKAASSHQLPYAGHRQRSGGAPGAAAAAAAGAAAHQGAAGPAAWPGHDAGRGAPGGAPPTAGICTSLFIMLSHSIVTTKCGWVLLRPAELGATRLCRSRVGRGSGPASSWHAGAPAAGRAAVELAAAADAGGDAAAGAGGGGGGAAAGRRAPGLRQPGACSSVRTEDAPQGHCCDKGSTVLLAAERQGSGSPVLTQGRRCDRGSIVLGYRLHAKTWHSSSFNGTFLTRCAGLWAGSPRPDCRKVE